MGRRPSISRYVAAPALCFLAALAVCLRPSPSAAKGGFDFDQVVERAKELAKQSFGEAHNVPKWLLDISYDQWRDIRFKPEKALWADSKQQKFTVQLFHPGLFYDRAIAISVVEKGSVHP